MGSLKDLEFRGDRGFTENQHRGGDSLIKGGPCQFANLKRGGLGKKEEVDTPMHTMFNIMYLMHYSTSRSKVMKIEQGHFYEMQL